MPRRVSQAGACARPGMGILAPDVKIPLQPPLPHQPLPCPTLSQLQGPLGEAGRAEQGRAEREAAGRHYRSQHRAGDRVKPGTSYQLPKPCAEMQGLALRPGGWKAGPCGHCHSPSSSAWSSGQDGRKPGKRESAPCLGDQAILCSPRLVPIGHSGHGGTPSPGDPLGGSQGHCVCRQGTWAKWKAETPSHSTRW